MTWSINLSALVLEDVLCGCYAIFVTSEHPALIICAPVPNLKASKPYSAAAFSSSIVEEAIWLRVASVIGVESRRRMMVQYRIHHRPPG